MPHPLPDFATPVPLSAGGSWTAACESIDERNDDAYYFVEVRDGESLRAEFWARVDLVGPLTSLFDRVRAIAESGATNTTYTGSVMWELKRKARGV